MRLSHILASCIHIAILPALYACGGSANESEPHGMGQGGGTASSASTIVGGAAASTAGGAAGGDGTGLGGAGADSAGGGSSSVGGTSGVAGSAGDLIQVNIGATCSQVGAKACTKEDPRSQMVCSAGNVWQWSADCPTGQVCDPRAGLKIGQCLEVAPVCNGSGDNVCDNDTMFECLDGGLLSSSQVCRSALCTRTGDACAPLECGKQNGYIAYDCKPECGYDCRLTGFPESSGVYFYDDLADEIFRMNGRIVISLPAAAELPTVPECPDVHLFVLYPDLTSPLDVRLPPEYWAVGVRDSGLPETYASVAARACATTSRFTGSATVGSSRALLIGTTDETAEPFNIVID